MSKRVSEFWTIWHLDGCTPRVCTVHRTQRNAVKEALRCERNGGSAHEVVQVTKLGEAQALKRRGRP